jgi:hypothetical protein
VFGKAQTLKDRPRLLATSRDRALVPEANTRKTRSSSNLLNASFFWSGLIQADIALEARLDQTAVRQFATFVKTSVAEGRQIQTGHRSFRLHCRELKWNARPGKFRKLGGHGQKR